MLVSCGDNLNPLESQGESSIQIEVNMLVAGSGQDPNPILAVWKIDRQVYMMYMELSVKNLGKKGIVIDSSFFSVKDIKGAAIYSSEKVALCDPTSWESLLDQVVDYYWDWGQKMQFILIPNETVKIGLFAQATTEPQGKLYLVYGSIDVAIPIQDKIEQSIADGKKTGEKPTSGGKASAEITSSDGAPMVLIPAGAFQMGSSDERQDERPIHTVYLDAFYIDKYEVTNAQYRKFVQATGHKEPEGFGIDWVEGNEIRFESGFKPWQDENFNSDDQPVVCVSWEDANAYADWAGKRLPTEAEWEKAARGGLLGKRYVWGDQYKSGGNFADEIFDGYTYPAPVGSFAPNGYGLYDMAGNVWEWCMDWYDPAYYTQSPKKNPTGPISGNNRILRGGSWVVSDADFHRVSARYYKCPSYSYADTGFRCTMDAR